MSNGKIGLDDLLTMSQDELEQRHNTLDGYIKREWRRGRRHEDLEIEACYFARELEWRRQVQTNHEKYLQNFRTNYSLEE
jgi:hypothetical protein